LTHPSTAPHLTPLAESPSNYGALSCTDLQLSIVVARRAGSRVLNTVFKRCLSLGVSDGSSAIRRYRTEVVNALRLEANNYDILQEVLVRAYAAGWRVLESPFQYPPNAAVPSKAHASLALAYFRTFWRLWKLRSSIAAARR
jgi:hypothetical protein